jgi:hypothetical protein
MTFESLTSTPPHHITPISRQFPDMHLELLRHFRLEPLTATSHLTNQTAHQPYSLQLYGPGHYPASGAAAGPSLTRTAQAIKRPGLRTFNGNQPPLTVPDGDPTRSGQTRRLNGYLRYRRKTYGDQGLRLRTLGPCICSAAMERPRGSVDGSNPGIARSFNRRCVNWGDQMRTFYRSQSVAVTDEFFRIRGTPDRAIAIRKIDRVFAVSSRACLPTTVLARRLYPAAATLGIAVVAAV